MSDETFYPAMPLLCPSSPSAEAERQSLPCSGPFAALARLHEGHLYLPVHWLSTALLPTIDRITAVGHALVGGLPPSPSRPAGPGRWLSVKQYSYGSVYWAHLI